MQTRIRSSWFFIRAYVFVVLLVVVVGVGLEALLMQRDAETVRNREAELVHGSFRYAESLYAASMEESAGTIAKQVSQATQLPALLVPLADFASIESQQAKLHTGKIVTLYDAQDRALFYRRLGDSDWVLQLGPATPIHNDSATWIVPLFYGLIALAVFIWIRPLMRDLASLEKTAESLGMQDFSARTDLPRSSWLYPLGAAFNSMAQRIEWLLQSHRELTHAVSHELRTPLSRLRFGLEMVATGNEDSRAQRLAAMHEDVDELNALAEEMLGYAELEQANLQANQTVLEPDWLEDYVGYYNRHSPGIPITLRSIPAATVTADERLLRRALDNLLGNAQRFASSAIDISLGIRDGCYQLCVCDDGPGIDPARREQVLSAYVRESAPGHKGFGLGLAIVKRAMDLHGGTVCIGTSERGGASITLAWPLAER